VFLLPYARGGLAGKNTIFVRRVVVFTPPEKVLALGR